MTYPKTPQPPTPERLLFIAIKKNADIQVNRLKTEAKKPFSVGCLDKARKIEDALVRLNLAIHIKNETSSDDYIICAPKLDSAEILTMKLSSIPELLNAKFSIWRCARQATTESGMEFNGWDAGFTHPQFSVRDALGIARFNMFNLPGFGSLGFFGALFGKVASERAVEEELRVLKP